MEQNKELGKQVANDKVNGDIVRQAFVPVDEDKLRDKNYMVSIRAALDSYCTVDGDGNRVISKKDLKSMMRKTFNLQVRKIEKVIETYLSLGIMNDNGDGTYTLNYIKPFITLDPETVKYCLTSLSELSFKVYCYLKNRYEQHQKFYSGQSPYTFHIQGKGGLLEVCGYYDNGRNNRQRMNWVLETLQAVGLIEISEPFPHLSNDTGEYNGWYRYLYRVNDRSHIQIKSMLQEYIEDMVYVYPDKYDGEQLPPIFIDGDKYVYDRKAFMTGLTAKKMVKDSRNLPAVEVALTFGDVPKYYLDMFSKVEKEWNGM